MIYYEYYHNFTVRTHWIPGEAIPNSNASNRVAGWCTNNAIEHSKVVIIHFALWWEYSIMTSVDLSYNFFFLFILDRRSLVFVHEQSVLVFGAMVDWRWSKALVCVCVVSSMAFDSTNVKCLHSALLSIIIESTIIFGTNRTRCCWMSRCNCRIF